MTVPLVYYSPALNSWVVGAPYQTGIDGAMLLIPEGYCFDMASVPRILWPWMGSFELGTRAPLVHDYCYGRAGHLDSMPPLELKRSQVDHLFLGSMRDEGVRAWKRGLAFWAVRWFGWLCWKHMPARMRGRPCVR